MEKIKAQDLQIGDRFNHHGDVVTVTSKWFYGTRVRVGIKYGDGYGFTVTMPKSRQLDKLN